MTDENVGFEEIDLEMSAEDEMKHLSSMDEVEAEQKDEQSDPTPDAEEKAEDDAAVEESVEDKKEPEDDPQALLKELQADRARLQEQLEQMARSSKASQDRVDALEARLYQPPQEESPTEPEGPTPEEILNHLDQRITALDEALVTAQAENPAAVPEIRKAIRQLDRYYNAYVAQQQMAAVQQTDPNEVVQRAVRETNEQNRFAATRSAIIEEFPMLNSKGDQFNEALRDQIHRFYNPMIAQGTDPVEALIEATRLVTQANGILSQSQLRYNAEQEAAAAANAQAAAAAVKTADTAAAQRKAESVEKNLSAAAATPPNLASVGNSGVTASILDKYDFEKMSVDDMMGLTPDQERQIEKALAMYGA